MSSEVADAQQAAAFDAVSRALDGLAAVGVAPFDAADARVVIAELEVLARRMRSFQVDVVDGVEQRGLHRVDGHASAKVLVRHVAKLSDVEAHRRAQAARALRDLPSVQAAFAAGRVGGCQVDRIARAHANRRVRERLCRQDEALALAAEHLAYRRFDGLVGDWVRRMDEDGTCDRDQRAHEDRDAKIVQDLDGGWATTASCASVQGAELHEILRRFVEAEFAADWA
ncbi:MAG TPA: DUF222 domain-containing protein [Aquihabitans sp.]|jgi:hypothetical protein|nr:DUF222 domain-containing protein [Aquihabitans sp.]